MICSILDIIRAVSSPHKLFRHINTTHLRRNAAGELYYSVGNSAVIFSLLVDNQRYALKCYTNKNHYRKAIYGDRLHQDELFIPSDQGGNYIDVVIEKWHEGITLHEALAKAAKENNINELSTLARGFDTLALRLLEASWAHGDLTCDNIIVDDLGELHLIDFDGMFLPEFAGQESLELGTQAFQHPLRDCHNFDSSIDDYSIALISSATHAIAIDPSLYESLDYGEGLLFDPAKAIKGCDEALQYCTKLFAERGEIFAHAIAMLLHSTTPTLEELYPLMRYKIEGIHAAATPTTPFCRNALWGYLNDFGREVIPPLFSEARLFSEAKAAIKIGTSWHFIDHQANVVINGSQYQNLRSFRQGIARALTAEGWIEIATPTIK